LRCGRKGGEEGEKNDGWEKYEKGGEVEWSHDESPPKEGKQD